MQLKVITKTEFDKLDISRQLLVNDHPHQYAVVDLGNTMGCYGLAWRSHQIKPIIQLSENQKEAWLGVDQKLARINLLDGSIGLLMKLQAPLLKILIVDNLVAVLTELEVLLFNSNGLLKCFLGLSDLAEDISFEKGNFLINLFDGTILTLNPYKFTFNESIEAYLASQPPLIVSHKT